MSTAISRKLIISPRVAELQARATIKSNLTLALVELITNSDDSYRRLENDGFKVDGRIRIEVMRKDKNAEIRVTDYAEGFDEKTMDSRVGEYGDDTSGFDEENAGRGYLGRGLKEAMIALGYGCVESVKDSYLHKCSLKGIEYDRGDRIRINTSLRSQIGVKENGTIVTLKAVNDGISIPLFENLKHSLEYYFSLRDIMSSEAREVLLLAVDSKNRIKKEERLSYILPKGELFCRKPVPIPEYPGVHVDLEIYRSTEPLSGQDEGLFRENGILIRSKGAILDITLTRNFEGNNYASRIFGRATCDYIDHLLRVKKEQVVRADRAGIDWTHPFSRALEKILNKEIFEFVQIEEKKAKEHQKSVESANTRKRYEASLPELNRIAKEELGKADGEGVGEEEGHPPQLPPNGFDFMPEYVQLVVDKESTLTLKAIVPKVVASGAIAKISSDTKEILVLTPSFTFDDKDAHPQTGLAIAHIRALGKQVGAEGVVTAEINGLKAEILIKVISRRKPIEPPPGPKKSGLFSGWDFSPNADSHQRVKYDRTTGFIIIATQAPSVATYFGPNGEGQDDGHCQVMLAELVVEAVCREIARRKIDLGKEPYLGDPSEAMNVVHNRLINKYAKKLHDLLVDRKFRR